MNIYLDVDGVLLDNGKPAGFVSSFLKYVLENYPDTTYWLTTRCNGSTEDVLRQIQNLFDNDTQKLLEKIKPTSWPITKVQAIDFSQPFLWFEDKPGYVDRQTLAEHNAIDNLILVNLENKPDQLRDFVEDFPLPSEYLSK